MIKIYCDGSCKPTNPGPMGVGIIIKEEDGRLKRLNYHAGEGTNNRAELLAAIMALRNIKEGSEVNIYTDSNYVCKGINIWSKNWIKKGRLGGRRNIVLNADLWRALLTLNKKYISKFIKVKGHSRNVYNILSDKEANKGAEKVGEAREIDKYNIFDNYFETLVHTHIYGDSK